MEHNIITTILRPVCYAVSLAIAGTAIAAPPTPAPDQQFGPGSELLDEPKLDDPVDTPQFQLPKLRKPTEQAQGTALKIFVKKIELMGNTVFSDEELAKLTAPYTNKILTTVEIQEIRQKLTLYYINKGYINSGAILPDQKISDGIVKMTIIEGELTRIDVSGNTGLNTEYVSERLALGGVTPLNLKNLQKHLRFMQQNPLIKQVNAKLNPGSKPGESILNVLVEEKSPYSFATYINNYRSPSIGSLGLGIEATDRNLTGRGDTISLALTKSEGIESGAFSYSLPLNAQDTTFKIRYTRSQSGVIEEPFTVIDIASEAETIGVELTHPVVKTADTTVVLGIGFDKRKSQSFLLDEPFSFSLGTDDGESRVTVMRLSQQYNKRSQNEAISLRSVFSFGIDAFDATVHDAADVTRVCGATATRDTCPDGDFSAWLGQASYVRRFNALERSMNIILRANAQIASESLLPVEQFSIGGARTVRGYRENQLVRDNGVVASAELRIPVIIGGDDTGKGGFPIQLVPFVDYGRSWNDGRTTPEPSVISSVGLGLLWNPDRRWSLEAYAAQNFHEIKNESDEYDLQDVGLHFQLSYRY
ncbi:MAG: ShlB/FhaC/HecB family hemolysin secretion/activation protein [Sulfuriflexus sp.]|nr:ShlB/FhaC/HecB family hemolysin secretion/activation protein [Sulfuriflexus sp.]